MLVKLIMQLQKLELLGFSKSVALELGSRNIRSNTIAPGFIETEMTGKLNEDVVKGWRECNSIKTWWYC